MKNSKEEELKELIDIQATHGNWDYDHYMHGMLNGMILSHHVIFAPKGDATGPLFNDAPKSWILEDEAHQTMLDLHAANPELLEAYNHYRFLLNIIKGEDSKHSPEEIHHRET